METAKGHEVEVVETQRLPAPAGEVNPLEIIERRNRLLEKILEYAIATTHAGHWTDLGGRPWLNGPGAEAVARRCAVKITEMRCTKEWMEDDWGRYYLYTYEAKFSLPGGHDEIIAFGHCSSRDGFLGTGAPADDKGPIRDISEVDEGNIRQSAYTNCEVNGVTRLLGIRGMSWERLEALGLRQAEVAKVEYKHGAKGGGQAGEFVFPFGRSKGKRPEEVADADLAWYRKTFTENLADPEKAKYRKNTEKQLVAVEAEIARRAAPKPAAAPAANGPVASAAPPTPWQRCLAAGRAAGLDEDAIKATIKGVTGKATSAVLTQEDAAKVEAAIARQMPPEEERPGLFDEGEGIPR